MNQSELSDRGEIVEETANSRPSPDSPVKGETNELYLNSSNERGSTDTNILISDVGNPLHNCSIQSDRSLFKSEVNTRQSVKRHEPLIYSPSGKSLYYHKDILEALQQTVIPQVPTTSETVSNQSVLSSPSTTTSSPEAERTESVTSTRNLIPTIDYFANTILYYHDGVFDTPTSTTPSYPVLPAFTELTSILPNPHLFDGEEDEDDDAIVVDVEDYDSDEDEIDINESEENVQDTVLPPSLAEREEGVVCTSLWDMEMRSHTYS